MLRLTIAFSFTFLSTRSRDFQYIKGDDGGMQVREVEVDEDGGSGGGRDSLSQRTSLLVEAISNMPDTEEKVLEEVSLLRQDIKASNKDVIMAIKNLGEILKEGIKK